MRAQPPLGELGIVPLAVASVAVKAIPLLAKPLSKVPVIGKIFGGKKPTNEEAAWKTYRAGAGSAAGHELDNQFRNQAWTGMMRGNRTTYPPRASGKYGTKDDDRLMDDIAAKLAAAVQSGAIGASDDASSIFAKVIEPWILSLGKPWAGSADDIRVQKQITIDQIDAWLYDLPTVSTGYTTSRWAVPRLSTLIKQVLPPVVAPTTAAPAPVPAVIPVTAPAPVTVLPAAGGAPAPGVPLPASAGAPSVAATPDVSSLISSMLAQGASQQQAFSSALDSLSRAGIATTPQVQAGVAQQVQAAASTPSWLLPAAAAAGAVLLMFVFRKKRR